MRKVKDASVWKSNTVRAQILRIFEEKGKGTTIQASCISDELLEIDYYTVYSTLARMAKKGELERVERGVYRLP